MPQKNYITNIRDVYYSDEIWSSDILDINNYGNENNRGHIFVLVVVDTFSNFRWTVPLKNRYAQIITNSF